eukprot:Awhi_evm1s744
MMYIKRLFTIVVSRVVELSDFERDFESISVTAVVGKKGYVSHEIGYPLSSNSRVYTMVSVWDSVESLVLFAGPSWATEPFIPHGMEQYVESCSVQHFSFRTDNSQNVTVHTGQNHFVDGESEACVDNSPNSSVQTRQNNFVDDKRDAIALTPENFPYYAVIFTSLRTSGNNGYGDMAGEMVKLAKEQVGFLGIESARDEVGITVSYWKDTESIKLWKKNVDHKVAQQAGKEL